VTLRNVLIAAGSFAVLLAFVYYCALPGDLPADTDSGDGLAGTYTVNGTDPSGVEYSGTVVVTAADDPDRYDIEWIVTGGIHRGTAVRSGHRLVVEWEAVASVGDTRSGTAGYDILADGRLIGSRYFDGFDRPGSEEIFPEP